MKADFSSIKSNSYSGSKKKGRFKPKGQQATAEAQQVIRQLFCGTTFVREKLIEYLHVLQDRFRCLHFDHLRALADELSISQAEIYETASFYHHFDIVKSAEQTPPEVTIRVCNSLSCMLAGSEAIIDKLKGNSRFRILGAPCMGNCANAPAAMAGKQHIDGASVESLQKIIDESTDTARFADVKPVPYPELHLDADAGDYSCYRALHSGKMTIDEVLKTISASGLQGLGGAGFPSARKWQFVRAEPEPRYMCVNADEGEPGTFKDRYYLENHVHSFLEGTLIAAYAVAAKRVYIYIRDEYPLAYAILQHAISQIEHSELIAQGYIKKDYIELRRGAGAYICGEESAMIESIEGKRGLPRHRPPYVAQNGVFARPTLVHNVETLYWLPIILQRGAKWFADQGKPNHKGLRSYSVSGRVKNPGIKIAPAGISVNELIRDYCDSMLDGHAFKAYLPGGASGGILPAFLGDLPLDFGSLQKHGCFIGSHAVIVLSDHDNIATVAANLMRFFKDESCGQCTPCRCGTEKSLRLMQKKHWNENLLGELADTMMDASICGLGQAAVNPLLCAMKFFPEDCGLDKN